LKAASASVHGANLNVEAALKECAKHGSLSFVREAYFNSRAEDLHHMTGLIVGANFTNF